MRSYYNRTLSGITGDIAQIVSGKLDVSIQPRFSGNIEYTVQHKESHFAYLKRLAAGFGEWFFYDGIKLHLGKPAQTPSFDLQYVRHLQNLKMNLQVVPMSFTHLSYQPVDDQVLRSETPQKVPSLNYLGDIAVQQSARIFQPVTHTPWQKATDAGTLDAATRTNKNTAAAQTFAIEAISRHPAPQPGARIRILFGDTELGEYVVTEAAHQLDNVNDYSCTFRALPVDIEVMPVAEVAAPYSGAQIATVVDNQDPQRMGRVRVLFHWQDEGSRTPWLRVLMPDAGGTDEVMHNRGFVFVPEVGDQVLVDFEEGNPDAPFVLGSVFHGKNSSGQTNMVRTIMTKSGNKVVLNDADGSITVSDPSGNEWFMDGQQNITVTAPKTLTMNAQDIHLNAGNTVAIAAGAQVRINALLQMLVATPYLQQLVTDYFHTQAGKLLLNSPEGELKIEAKQLLAAGQEQMFLHSDQAITANSKGALELKGHDGNNHTNVPENYEVQREDILAKCMVMFRPNGKYEGEFGFDWLRYGDTGRRGDPTWIRNIMGKYYNADNKTVFADTNDWNNNFRRSSPMYDRLLRSYSSFNVPWKIRRGQTSYLYPIPTITLLNGKSATLNLKVEIEEVPKELTLEFENKNGKDFYSLNLEKIGDIRKGVYEKFDYLTIRCLKECNVAQTLYVKADGQICGALKIAANGRAAQKHINVVFINVQTNINGPVVTGVPASNGESFFRQCLNQAIVIPNLVIAPAVLNLRGDRRSNTFRRRFCTRSRRGVYTITKDDGLREYLEQRLTAQFGNRYDRHYKIFFIGDTAAWNGFSFFNSTFCVCFGTHNRATIAHETFHAMSVSHTFAGVGPNTRYTYQALRTDNIMDYSHVASPPIDRCTFFKWQWKVLNPNIR